MMMPSYLVKSNGWTLEEMETKIKEYQAKHEELFAESQMYVDLSKSLQNEYILDTMRDKGIKEGDAITIVFADIGRVSGIYCGVRSGDLQFKHYTTKGKLCKNASQYGYWYAAYCNKPEG